MGCGGLKGEEEGGDYFVKKYYMFSYGMDYIANKLRDVKVGLEGILWDNVKWGFYLLKN